MARKKSQQIRVSSAAASGSHPSRSASAAASGSAVAADRETNVTRAVLSLDTHDHAHGCVVIIGTPQLSYSGTSSRSAAAPFGTSL